VFGICLSFVQGAQYGNKGDPQSISTIESWRLPAAEIGPAGEDEDVSAGLNKAILNFAPGRIRAPKDVGQRAWIVHRAETLSFYMAQGHQGVSCAPAEGRVAKLLVVRASAFVMSSDESEGDTVPGAALGEISTAMYRESSLSRGPGDVGLVSRTRWFSAFRPRTGRARPISPGHPERHRAAEEFRFFRDTLDSERIPVGVPPD